MAEVNIQTVTLSGYKASVQGAQYLRLGTWNSYGIEQLQIVPGTEWTGLIIKAVFVTAAGTTSVIVPDSGLINVPPEATAQALCVKSPGMIVFSGVAAGVQRITCNLLYLVSDHAPIDGTEPQPTPDQWEQLIEKYQEMLNAAVPPTGTTGYVLTKTDDGTAWQEPQGGGGAGVDGGYYTPSITQIAENTAEVSWEESDDTMPPIDPVTLTLPRGPQGAPGQDGKDGQQGPQGEPGRDGQDGAPGADGITPSIGENGNWYLGDTDTGKPSRGETGPQGEPGTQGPAYTLTDSDKQVIVQAVLAALPVYNGEVQAVG